MRAPALGLLVAASLVVSGCGTGLLPGVTGSGTVVESDPETDPFSTLAVGSAFEVTLVIGDEPGVVVRADDNLIDAVTVAVEADELSIDVGSSVREATLQATVTVLADGLSGITLSEASTLTGTEALSPSSLDVRADDASRAFLVVSAEEVRVDADGASVVNMTGTASALTADADSASSLRLDQLSATSAVLSASSASRIDATVTEQLSATAAGASTITYRGEPEVSRSDATGESTIEPG